jgi:hypothetical protein
MCYAAVLERLITLEHTVVAQHCRDPKPIISKDILPALSLNVAMNLIVAPRVDGGFVPPERERNELRRIIDTLEALDGDKPVQGHAKAVGVLVLALILQLPFHAPPNGARPIRTTR